MFAEFPHLTVLADVNELLKDDDFLSECSRTTNLPALEVKQRIEIYLGEAKTGLSLVDGLVARNQRVLEVGCGLGLVSAHLAELGYDVVAIEPGLGGFDFNSTVGALIRRLLDIDLSIQPIEAQNLSADQHGRFDLIFSTNVLEHIPDWRGALDGMIRVLKPQGTMRHSCPNYWVPYEPHFGIPLVPVFPKLTSLFRPSLTTNELWKSLNFLTLGQVRRAAYGRNLQVSFQRELLFAAFKRLEADPSFGGRHPRIITMISTVISRIGLIGLLRFLPPALSTPMIFDLSRQEQNQLDS